MEKVKVDVKNYDYFVGLLKDISNSRGSYLRQKELIKNNYGLPNSRWFVKHCPDESVRNYSNFIEWCGFRPKHGASKEKTIEIIYEMQSRLNRPIMLDDFANPLPHEVGRAYVDLYWDGLNDMKQELGLEIVQENMTARQRSYTNMKGDLLEICEYIYKNENRIMITTHDINEHCKVGYQTYYKIFKENGTTVRAFLEESGFKLQNMGVGFNHYFEDGESVYSRYEYDLSRILRSCGLVFNTDYFRDVQYREFISDYDGLLNCDYVLNIGKDKVYIEIAGMLRDHEHEYYNDKTIKSGIKEEYRKTLIKKRKMLENNNLNHHIILPRNCNEDFLMKILSN